MKELTLEEYITEMDACFTALRKVPSGIHTMIEAGRSVQKNTDDQAVKTQVFFIDNALKHLQTTALNEMVNISESLRALERLQNNQPEVDKGDPDIADPNVDLPEV